MMQTFLPYADFQKCAEALDYKRLGKQRVECWQILLALRDTEYGWQHHPAVNMWRHHDRALIEYALLVCNEWVRRGYKDSMTQRFVDAIGEEDLIYPPWLGDPAFHASHRSNLKRKDPAHYAGFTEPDDMPYVWPVSNR